ncbi:MAG: ThiF family adenylyltransferase, partial [Nitrososphaerales archaeon]
SDPHSFLDKRVLITGDSFVLTPNGKACLTYATRLVAKVCRNVSISLPGPAAERVEDARTLAAKAAIGAAISVDASVPDPSEFDAILSVSRRPLKHHRSTTINSNGWLCRVGTSPLALEGSVDQNNPIGALAAASLGASEVFKRLISLKPERGRPLEGLTFSVFSYSCGGIDPGPLLPTEIPLDLGLVGLGAIGNATATLLADLPVSGRALAIDHDFFEDVNLATCLSIEPPDVGESKADFTQRLLSRRLEVHPFTETVQQVSERFGSSLRFPAIFADGLHDIESRIFVQGLWPDLVVDGAMGGQALAQVSVHPWGPDVGCLKCLFREPAGEPTEVVQVRATGLRRDRVIEADSPVTDQDVADAPEGRREWLRDRVGRPICSVIEEGVADDLSQSRQRTEFRPAVPFVATMSASMVVGELVRRGMGLSSPLEPRYHLDLFQGPGRGQLVPQTRRIDCECTVRHANIERFRRLRAEAQHSSERGPAD